MSSLCLQVPDAAPSPAVANRPEVGAGRAERSTTVGVLSGSGGNPAAVPLAGSQVLGIGGLERWSTCDWPGKLVATVFLQGCPWRCVYCHNPDLIDCRTAGSLTWAEVLAFVSRRRGLLDGVVFSGGEATRQPLEGAIQDLRDLGMAVGLHTSGAYPMRLARLLPLVDWVGFDVKALPQHLAEVTGRPAAARAMTTALRLLLESGVDCQVRTTWGAGVPHLSTPAEAAAVLEWARAQGVESPVLQQVRVDGTSPEFTANHLAAKRAAATAMTDESAARVAA